MNAIAGGKEQVAAMWAVFVLCVFFALGFLAASAVPHPLTSSATVVLGPSNVVEGAVAVRRNGTIIVTTESGRTISSRWTSITRGETTP